MRLPKIFKNIYYKYLLSFLRKQVAVNLKFKDKYEGQECYIIGNGYSIKYFDLKKFQNKISFGCNNLFYHRDFSQLNCKFYITVHSSIYSPFWFNPYSKKLSYNFFSKEYKRKILENNHINFFLNLNDYFFTKNLDNVFYLSNFNKKINFDNFGDPSNFFQYTTSSIETMISLAYFLGFKKLYLVGCDYLLHPTMCGRFYENHNEEIIKNFNSTSWKDEFFNNVSKKIDVKIISYEKNFQSKYFKVIDYSEYFSTDTKLKKNYEIVTKKNLKLIKNFNMEYSI
mgnify:CR=1 FL=1